jgi:hypothetical protein
LPNTVGSNLFCSAALVLPNGGGVPVAVGGPESNPNEDTRIFDYGSNTLTRYDDLNRGRYCASTRISKAGSVDWPAAPGS